MLGSKGLDNKGCSEDVDLSAPGKGSEGQVKQGGRNNKIYRRPAGARTVMRFGKVKGSVFTSTRLLGVSAVQ